MNSHNRPIRTKQMQYRTRWKARNKQAVRVSKESYPWQVLRSLFIAIGSHLDDDDKATIARIIDTRDVEQYLSLSSEWGLQSIDSSSRLASQKNWEVRVMLSNVLKKYPFLGDSKVREDRAIETVLQGEEYCSEFNRFGRKRLIGVSDPVLNEARWLITKVLGSELPTQELLTRGARHGPGASTGTISGRTSAYDKYAGWPYDVTPGCFDHACDLLDSDERWSAALIRSVHLAFGIPLCYEIPKDLLHEVVFKRVKVNKITTVPKDARKDRPIAIEPEINMMLQLGVHDFVVKRLKPWGIDLTDQTKNQKLAYAGSLRADVKSPATIDLEMASDTISLGIAKLLLPEPWFRYLCDLRSPAGLLPNGSKIRYSKLSSMGNGSTFAIESLIFFALTFGANKVYFGHYPKDVISVFGDDIITPEGSAGLVARFLKLSGFRINHEKSFLQGSVKESCGTDWYRGLSMRPVHLKECPGTVGELYSARNRLYRWLCLHAYDTSEALEALDGLYRRWIPSGLYFEGPLSNNEYDTYWHSTCSGWRRSKSHHKNHYGNYVGRELYVRYAKRRPEELEFDFVKLCARLVPGESYVTHDRLPVWFRKRKPEQVSSSSGSVFDVYNTNSIRRGVRQRIWYSLPDSYSSVEDLLFKRV